MLTSFSIRRPATLGRAVTIKFKAKEQIQAAIAREIELLSLGEVYEPAQKPNERNFTNGQLQQIVDLIIKTSPSGNEANPKTKNIALINLFTLN